MRYVIYTTTTLLLAALLSWWLIGSGVQPEPFVPFHLPTLEVGQ